MVPRQQADVKADSMTPASLKKVVSTNLCSAVTGEAVLKSQDKAN